MHYYQGDWVIRYSTIRHFHGLIKAWNWLRIELIKNVLFYSPGSSQKVKGRDPLELSGAPAKFAYHTYSLDENDNSKFLAWVAIQINMGLNNARSSAEALASQHNKTFQSN